MRSAISAVAENRRCLPLPVLIIATKRTILPPLWEETLAATDKGMRIMTSCAALHTYPLGDDGDSLENRCQLLVNNQYSDPAIQKI